MSKPPELPYVTISYMTEMPKADLKAQPGTDIKAYEGWFDMKTQTLYPNIEGEWEPKKLEPLQISSYRLAPIPNFLPSYLHEMMAKKTKP